MAIPPGRRLGPYEILTAVGAGGMGEVYRARDTRLNRIVAIKVLPTHLADRAELRERFEREARTIASLNHPHICTLHDIGQQDGTDYLVMEYLEGETLAHRLQKGALPLEQVLQYAIEISDALDKAHRKGVTHRDLKPGNIMLTKTGTKLLDFGLAKLKQEVAPANVQLSQLPTANDPLTAHGAIVGTLQYMAPEQLEGKEVDARTDIFAFGAVVYEMATGKRAFEGKSQASLIAAILEREPPPMSKLQPMTPPALDHLVRKCLPKLADERWQSAGDLASELKWVAESGGHTDTTVPQAAARKAREAVSWFISCALLVALIAGAIWWRGSRPQEQAMYFSAPLPFPARDIAIAPNGHTVVVAAYQEFARKNTLWVYELGAQDARSLAGTEGAAYPFWSADGQSVAFFADGKLKKLELSGGQAQTLCDAPSGRGGTWNKHGVIVFTPDAALGRGMYRVPASGGTPMPISSPDPNRKEQSHRWPVFLPDGTHYLYFAGNFSGQKGVDAVYVGSLDSNEKRFIVEATGNAAYAAPGYLLFTREKTLLAQRFDLKGFALTGEPTAILSDIEFQPQVKNAVFAVSDNGLLIAQTGSGVALSQPLWFDHKGNTVGMVSRPDVYGNVSIAPNGRSLAVDKTDMASLNTDVWTDELQRESAKRLTFDPSFDVDPIWSPDSSRLVFATNRGLAVDLYMKNSDGAQEEKRLVSDDRNKISNDWSRDGRYILYARDSDLWFVTVPELKSTPFLKAVSVLRNGRFSPDGKWVAYASNESGRWEIYVTSFPEARGKWQISTGGGEQPRWRGDGKELFYLSSDYKMMAAPVTTGTNFDVGTPVVLFQATPRQPVSTNDQSVYDVSRDSQRFLILTQVKQAETQSMSVILNWAAKLNK